MRHLGRVAVLLTLFLAARGTLACGCATSSLQRDIYDAQDVFVGVAQKVDNGDVRSGRKATFAVVKSIKGIAHDHYEVWTAYDPTDCGILFKEGVTYLVFARDLGGAHVTALCDGTRLLGCDASPEVAQLTGFTGPPGSVYDENFPCVTAPILVGDLEPEFRGTETPEVSLVVDADGKVAEVRFKAGRCTPECLARRAAFERTIRSWRFMPAMRNGQPVAYRFHDLSRSSVPTTTQLEVWK